MIHLIPIFFPPSSPPPCRRNSPWFQHTKSTIFPLARVARSHTRKRPRTTSSTPAASRRVTDPLAGRGLPLVTTNHHHPHPPSPPILTSPIQPRPTLIGRRLPILTRRPSLPPFAASMPSAGLSRPTRAIPRPRLCLPAPAVATVAAGLLAITADTNHPPKTSTSSTNAPAVGVAEDHAAKTTTIATITEIESINGKTVP